MVASQSVPQPPLEPIGQRWLDRLARQWFLLALAATIAIGLSFSPQLMGISAAVPRDPIVALVLLLMSLPLAAGTMWQVARRPFPAILAVSINMGLLPLLAWLVARGLPFGLAEGTMIMATVPCTMASAAVWTRRAGGNDAIALWVTMTTSLMCALVTPAWVLLLTRTEVEIPFASMASRLTWVVVLPILAGQVLRLSPRVAAAATDHKTRLSVIAQFGILSLVFVGTVRSGQQLRGLSGESVAWYDWALMFAGAVGIHLAALAAGFWSAIATGVARADAIAVAIAGSQKTLTVALMLGIKYSEAFGGLAVLPMVAYHVLQLFADTLVADRLRERGGQANRRIVE